MVVKARRVTFYASEPDRDRRSRLAIRDAVKVCGGRQRFAWLVGVDKRTVARWLAGSRKVSPSARIIAHVVLIDPGLLPVLEGAARASHWRGV